MDVFSCSQDVNGCAVTQLEQDCQWVSLEDCYYRQGEAMCLSRNPSPEVTFSTSFNGNPVTTFDISQRVYGRVIHIDSEVIEACAAVEGSVCEDGDFAVLTDAPLWSLASDGYVRADWIPQNINGAYTGDITYNFRGEGSSRVSSVTLTLVSN